MLLMLAKISFQQPDPGDILLVILEALYYWI